MKNIGLRISILCVALEMIGCSFIPKIPPLLNEKEAANAYNMENGIVAFRVFRNKYLSVDIDLQNQETKIKYRLDTNPPTVDFLSVVWGVEDPESICENIALFEIPKGTYKIIYMQISKEGKLHGSKINGEEFKVLSGKITSFGLVQMTIEEGFLGQFVKSVNMKTVDLIPESEFESIQDDRIKKMDVLQAHMNITGS